MVQWSTAASLTSILILKVCGRKVQKESAENPAVRITDVTESDSSLKNKDVLTLHTPLSPFSR